MKKRLLLLFVLLLFIASCGEEETPPIVDGDNSVDIDSRGDDLSRPDIDDSADSAPDEDSGNTADSVTDADEADSGDSAEDGDSANTGDSTSDADACISGTIESQDCDTSGKQIRTCESGVWSDYSDCLDITTKIRDIASTSACADISWLDRGSAPSAYIQGVGLVFASAVCNNTRDDIVLASQAKTTDLEHDALAWYDDINIFANLGMSNDVAGMATLRHAYTLITGLGMRESSGEHCCGRDTSATNSTAETAEAGLFQTSYNSGYFSSELPILFTYWKEVKATNPKKCLLEVFSEGVTCSATDWENYGTGDGEEFQDLAKTCPAFAVEYVAVMLRVCGGSKGHYGPLKRREAEVQTSCDTMLLEIQQTIETDPYFCNFLVNY